MLTRRYWKGLPAALRSKPNLQASWKNMQLSCIAMPWRRRSGRPAIADNSDHKIKRTELTVVRLLQVEQKCPVKEPIGVVSALPGEIKLRGEHTSARPLDLEMPVLPGKDHARAASLV
jgi:hypothetical protein